MTLQDGEDKPVKRKTLAHSTLEKTLGIMNTKTLNTNEH